MTLFNTPPTPGTYSPGVLLHARGREWVVQPGSHDACLRLRPFGGSEEDIITLVPELEFTRPRPAVFPWPDPEKGGNHDAAVLLKDALQLKLRAGAGPFRSFGNISVEPRAYQLVPLMMALRLGTVRLLIADDVGIGKTIEAGLIVRELIDRGEIFRFSVLCPPHLVDQWVHELTDRFYLKAVALTASSVKRVERELPQGVSIFDHYPVTVVSLDYIKSERHREHFLSTAPECIVVDEAHACASVGKGKQLRFELLKRLTEDETRHLIMLTATPHSGDDVAFHNLLSLLKPGFSLLRTAPAQAIKSLREDLARHFVQRRRKDIEEWQETDLFPRRMTSEITYAFSGPWGAFFDEVQDYCTKLAERTEQAKGEAARLIWYATLALLRCVSSSPKAAVRALTTRLTGAVGDMETVLEENRLFDGEANNLEIDDLEPAAGIDEAETLKTLIETANRLTGIKEDPKLHALIRHLSVLIKEGFRPVIFCRYLATAHYVAEQIRHHFKAVTVEAVTGEYTPEERELRIEALGEADHPVLVATDCLSEGVNLQHIFNAVIHYDLAWNPTRHEQREGRVDRFGQKEKEVRCTILYGQDNPVDGFILKVILRKAESIKRELGVLVPMPEDAERINQALIKASLMKRRKKTPRQLDIFEDFKPKTFGLDTFEIKWQDALEKAKANRTVFAQRRLKPEEVLPEWRKQCAILGGEAEVKRFVKNACARLGTPLEPFKRDTFRLLPHHLPQTLKERFNREGISSPLTIDFHYPAAAGVRFVHRSDPIVRLLAESVLEGALSGETAIAARSAATVTADVDIVTVIYLLRIRHQLTITGKFQGRTLMAEENAAIAVRGRANPQWVETDDIMGLLNVTPSANLPITIAEREIKAALDFLETCHEKLNSLAHERAEALLNDHRRVREAARDLGSYKVTPALPVDVMGVYVLLPDSL